MDIEIQNVQKYNKCIIIEPQDSVERNFFISQSDADFALKTPYCVQLNTSTQLACCSYLVYLQCLSTMFPHPITYPPDDSQANEVEEMNSIRLQHLTCLKLYANLRQQCTQPNIPIEKILEAQSD